MSGPSTFTNGTKPLLVPATVLDSYLLAVVMLGPLLGSSAGASTAFTEHFADDGNRMGDLLGSLALLLTAASLVWMAVNARAETEADPV